MARGKYSAKAKLREQEGQVRKEADARKRLEDEVAKLRQAEEDAVLLEEVLTEIRELQVADPEVASQCEALREEIVAILGDLGEAIVIARKARRHRDKRMLAAKSTAVSAADRKRQMIATMESLAEAHGLDDAVINDGVYVGKGLDVTAIKRIQKARGWR